MPMLSGDTVDDGLARTRVLTRTQARPDEGTRVRSPAVVANEAQQLPCLRLRGPSLTLSLRPLPPQVRRNHGPGKGVESPAVPLSACSARARSREAAGGTGPSAFAHRSCCHPSPRHPAHRAGVPPPRSQNPESEPGHRTRPRAAPCHRPCPAHARGLVGAGSVWKLGLGSRLWTPPFNRPLLLIPDNCVHLPSAGSKN